MYLLLKAHKETQEERRDQIISIGATFLSHAFSCLFVFVYYCIVLCLLLLNLFLSFFFLALPTPLPNYSFPLFIAPTMTVEPTLRFVRTRPLAVLVVLFSLVFLTFYHGGQPQLPNVSQIGTELSNRLMSQTASRLARSEILYQRHVTARKAYLTSRSGYRE